MAANRANYIAWPETVAHEENPFFDKNLLLSTAVTTHNLLPIDGVVAGGSSANMESYTASIESGRHEEWDQHRDTIQRLLITEGHTLAAVREIMLHEYGLRGTEAQYKRRITHWGLRQKNITKKKMLKILRRQSHLQKQGKQAVFLYHQQPIAEERLNVARKRYAKELDPVSPTDSIISNVECIIPRPVSSPPGSARCVATTSPGPSSPQGMAGSTENCFERTVPGMSGGVNACAYSSSIDSVMLAASREVTPGDWNSEGLQWLSSQSPPISDWWHSHSPFADHPHKKQSADNQPLFGHAIRSPSFVYVPGDKMDLDVPGAPQDSRQSPDSAEDLYQRSNQPPSPAKRRVKQRESRHSRPQRNRRGHAVESSSGFNFLAGIELNYDSSDILSYGPEEIKNQRQGPLPEWAVGVWA